MTLQEIARRKKELNQLIKTLKKSVKSIDEALQREDYLLDLEYDVEQILIESYASIEYVYKGSHSFIPSAQSRIDHRLKNVKNAYGFCLLKQICHLTSEEFNKTGEAFMRSCLIKIINVEKSSCETVKYFLCEIKDFYMEKSLYFILEKSLFDKDLNLLGNHRPQDKIFSSFDEACTCLNEELEDPE